MSKDAYINLLSSLQIPINEGIQNDNDKDVYPRIVFWEMAWDPIASSNDVYETKVTYQTSFFSRNPRDLKLLDLRTKLFNNNIYPTIYHEYIEESDYFHSYFSIELLENINE